MSPSFFATSRIQDSLVEKYGKEAESINLVNGNLEKQIDLLNDLSESQLKDYFKDEENRKGAKESTKRMTEKKTYNLGNISSDSEGYDIVTDIVKDFKDKGLELVGGSGGMAGAAFTIKINGDAKSVESTISEVMDKLDEAKKGADEATVAQIESLQDSMSKSYSKASDIVEENEAGQIRTLKKKMIDMSNAIISQDNEDLNQDLEDEYQKIHDWGLDDYADQIKNETLQSQFGNVDMDNRKIIDWNIDNIEKWKDALSDIKYYDDDGNFLESYYDQLKKVLKKGKVV